MGKHHSREIAELDAASARHPEEMKSVVSFRIGDAISFDAVARTTPAGIVSVGVAIGLAVLAFSALARARQGLPAKRPPETGGSAPRASPGSVNKDLPEWASKLL